MEASDVPALLLGLLLWAWEFLWAHWWDIAVGLFVLLVMGLVMAAMGSIAQLCSDVADTKDKLEALETKLDDEFEQIRRKLDDLESKFPEHDPFDEFDPTGRS